jgi:hypothetical protein
MNISIPHRRRQVWHRLFDATCVAAVISTIVGVAAASPHGTDGRRAADLVVASVSAPPASSAPGATFVVSDTTANRGKAAIAAPTTTTYSLTRASRQRVAIGRRTTPPLRAGATSVGAAKLTIPARLEPGRYAVVACADARNDVRERDESNNCSAFDRPIDVVVPDLSTEPLRFTGVPRDPSNASEATFTFQSSIRGATFACQLNGGEFVACTSPTTYRDVPEGMNELTVKTRSGAPTHSAVTTFRWFVDKTAPVVTVERPASSATFTEGEVVTADYSCSVGTGSPIASCTGTTHLGAAVDTDQPGPHRFVVIGSDSAGNAATVEVAYTVNPTAGPTPDFKWRVPPRMVGDGVTVDDAAAPARIRASFDACPARRGMTYVWTGIDVIGPVDDPDGPRLRSMRRRPRDPVPDPPRPDRDAACKASAFVPVGQTTLVTLQLADSEGRLTTPRTEAVHPRDYLIVSLGDSFASGDGAPVAPQEFDFLGFVSKGPEWSDRRCHRSARSAPSLAAAALEAADPHSTITFVHLACSGSIIGWPIFFDTRPRGGLFGSDTGADPCCVADETIPSQLGRLALLSAQRPIDAVTISAGGNDVGFGSITAACAADLLNVVNRDWTACDRDAYLLGRLNRSFEVLPGKLDELRNRLDDIVDLQNVYVTGYPDLMDGAPGPLLLLGGVTASESLWAARNLIDPLNRALSSDRGWNYVPPGPEWAGHGVAAGDDRWVNSFEDSLIVQGPIPRTCTNSFLLNVATVTLQSVLLAPCIVEAIGLVVTGALPPGGVIHPNELGYRALAGALQSRIRLPGYGT